MQLQELTYNFSGPLFFDYVWWILIQANMRGIQKLYFLARDGYILCKMAEIFCSQYSLDIECKYVYCSRASLRMPTYHLIGDEAYDLLFLGGCRVTLCSLLQRVGLNETERKMVYEECAFNGEDEHELLNGTDLRRVCEKLRNSIIYKELITKKSKLAYRNAIGYFRQEGLLDQTEIAIVDSGWTGSMQRSLRQLLQSAGFKGKITGFYFGMYAKPKEIQDGTYVTWYFNHSSKISHKIKFSNNLFECMLSAPHGMTKNYTYENGCYKPVFDEPPTGYNLTRIEENVNAIMDYTRCRIKNSNFWNFRERDLKKETKKSILRYMIYPKSEEANFLGSFLFCDDITEAYHLKLADPKKIQSLEQYIFHKRFFRKIFGLQKKYPELFWIYGTIAFLPLKKQSWYRLNVFLWEWLRFFLTLFRN